MKFRVLGGPRTSGPLSSDIHIEAKHSDTFKTIFKKVQKAAGKSVPLDGYDLFIVSVGESSGHFIPRVGPLRSTDTPDAHKMDRKQKEPHVLMLVDRTEDLGSMARSLSHSNSLSYGGTTGDAGSVDATSTASATPVTTPRADGSGSYRRRMLAMFLKYDPEKVSKVDVALERYAGYEEDVIQQLVHRYGPEPAAGEVDTSPAAVVRAVAASAAAVSRSTSSSHKKVNEGASYRDRLVAIYTTYEPEKLSKVEGTLRHYAGREEEVIQQLLKKYGPEPPIQRAAPPPVSSETSPAPLPPPHVEEAAAAAAAAATPTTITMSEVPAAATPTPTTTPGYELTPAPTNVGAADSLPVTPRNLQEDFGRGSSTSPAAISLATSMNTAPASVADSAPSSPSRPLTYRDRLTAMYATYDPTKVRLVDGTLKKYKGREEAVLKQLVKMYGPEPSAETVAAAKAAAAIARRASKVVTEEAAPAPPTVEEPASPLEAEAAADSAPAEPAEAAAVTSQSVSVKEATEPPVVVVVAAPAVNLPAASPALQEAAVETTATEAAASSPLSPPTEEPIAVEEEQPEEEPKDESKAVEEEEGDRYRERLVALYHTYNPSKLHTVEGTLRKFVGKEEAAIQQLVRRYGPEPPALTTAEAQELLQSASGGSPMPSPRTPNSNAPLAPTPAATTEVQDNVSSTSAQSSKLASPVEQTADNHDAGYRERIHALLATHDPERVDKVDAIMSRYQGKEEEVIGKLEQRYGLQKSSGGSVVVAMEEELSTPRPAMPPPAPAAVETPPPPAAAVVPQRPAAPVVQPPYAAVSPVTPLDASPTVDGDEATRPTAPPSQRSSSTDSHPTTTTSDSSQQTDEREAAVQQAATHEESAAPMTTTSPSTAVPVAEAAPSSPPPSAPPVAPPPPPPLRALRNFAAVAKVAATHLSSETQRTVLQRYWAAWQRHHVKAKGEALLRDELWVAATSGPGYQLNDTVQPPYTVADLSTIVAQEAERRATTTRAVAPAAFSSESEMAARALLSALRHCVESRVVEVRSPEDEELARRFLAHWTVADHLCPVRDTPEFAAALHQAAHLIAQLDDLMTVIRTQAGQLQQLKNLHKDVVQRMEGVQTRSTEVDRLRAELDSANAQRRGLEAELKHLSSHTGTTAAGRPPSRPAQRAGERRASSPPHRVFPTVEERKDAQIAKLQQELAKTRNSLFTTKEAEEKMRVQVQQATARDARRERDERRREGPPGHHSRPGVPGTRSSSGPSGQRGARPSSVSASPRGTFSHAIALDTPRRPSESPGMVEHNGRAVSSIRSAGIEAQDRSNASLSSNTPWPVSRFAMTEEVERGPCPTCLTPLTSCSAEARGPADAKAAFCFSCRRSFTFGELRARDARDAVDNL